MLSAVTDEPERPTAPGVKVKDGSSADHAVVEQVATKATDANACLVGVQLSGFISCSPCVRLNELFYLKRRQAHARAVKTTGYQADSKRHWSRGIDTARKVPDARH
jgi:hypothetical protein